MKKHNLALSHSSISCLQPLKPNGQKTHGIGAWRWQLPLRTITGKTNCVRVFVGMKKHNVASNGTSISGLQVISQQWTKNTWILGDMIKTFVGHRNGWNHCCKNVRGHEERWFRTNNHLNPLPTTQSMDLQKEIPTHTKNIQSLVFFRGSLNRRCRCAQWIRITE